MSDEVRLARQDLAFLRGLAEDRGPLPRLVGEQMLAVGVLYGANVIYAWAGKSGLAPWPAGDDAVWGWLPAVLLHAPFSLWSARRHPGMTVGPALRMFTAAWFAMVLMTAAIVAAIYAARARTGIAFELIWPAVAAALYGGAWTVAGAARRSASDLVVAAGCFATAVTCGALAGSPAIFLALGVGIVLFIGGPGLAILIRARR